VFGFGYLDLGVVFAFAFVFLAFCSSVASVPLCRGLAFALVFKLLNYQFFPVFVVGLIF